MVEPQTEKRSTRRFALDLPIAVKFLDNGTYEVTGRTRDVSYRGVFFFVESEIALGARIEFILTLPAEITLTEPIRVRCHGKVVRLDGGKGAHQRGVAVAIEKYDFVREN